MSSVELLMMRWARVRRISHAVVIDAATALHTAAERTEAIAGCRHRPHTPAMAMTCTAAMARRLDAARSSVVMNTPVVLSGERSCRPAWWKAEVASADAPRCTPVRRR
ncbi:MAG: hypothetical protein R2710_15390 [Acidimicrobiales bacterium]